MATTLDTRHFSHLSEANVHVYKQGAMILSDGLKKEENKLLILMLHNNKK